MPDDRRSVSSKIRKFLALPFHGKTNALQAVLIVGKGRFYYRRFFGNHSDLKITGAFREGDIRHGVADLTKARALFGYEPKWSFTDGLRKFLSWALENELPDNRYEQSLDEMKQRGLLLD